MCRSPVVDISRACSQIAAQSSMRTKRICLFRSIIKRSCSVPWREPPNQQLQRTVVRRRVRAAGAALPLCACGAHDTSSRGR